jgi:hypothetical protein
MKHNSPTLCALRRLHAGNVMVDADLGTTQPAEILLSLIGAGTVKAEGLLMADPLHFETSMQAVPRMKLKRGTFAATFFSFLGISK